MCDFAEMMSDSDEELMRTVNCDDILHEAKQEILDPEEVKENIATESKPSKPFNSLGKEELDKIENNKTNQRGPKKHNMGDQYIPR